MKPRNSLMRVAFLIVLISAVTLAQPAFAMITLSNGMAAKLVLGQPNFTSHSSNATRKTMYGPTSVAVDPTTHKVFVADQGNSRVLRFKSLYALTNGANAEAVLGQPDFTSNTAHTTRSGMFYPWGVFVDSAGRLWVADESNNRVLRFDHASTKSSGANADRVLGQPNFTSSDTHTTRNGMSGPEGVFMDAGGRLWVSECNNSRVLRFNNAASLSYAANASGVLGQADFTHVDTAITKNRMSCPFNMKVDAGGRLWVADTYNNRVLRFNNAASKPNGAYADGVLGQPGYTSAGSATSRNGIYSPEDVAVDNATGRLYVTDDNNNRILAFNSAASLGNGANASYVLGQTVFTTNASGASAKMLNAPVGLFFDQAAKVLFATDFSNNRVLMYGTPSH